MIDSLANNTIWSANAPTSDEPVVLTNYTMALEYLMGNEGLSYMSHWEKNSQGAYQGIDFDKMQVAAKILNSLYNYLSSPPSGVTLSAADHTLLTAMQGGDLATLIANPTPANIQALQKESMDPNSSLSQTLTLLTNCKLNANGSIIAAGDKNFWFKQATYKYDGTGILSGAITNDLMDWNTNAASYLNNYEIYLRNTSLPNHQQLAEAQLQGLASLITQSYNDISLAGGSGNPFALIFDTMVNQQLEAPDASGKDGSGTLRPDNFLTLAQQIAGGDFTNEAEFVAMMQPPNNTQYGDGKFGNDMLTYIGEMLNLIENKMFTVIKN